MTSKRIKPIVDKLKKRLRRGANLASNAGMAETTGFIVAIPFWWLAYGLILALSYWGWSLALNSIGIQRGTFAQGIGRDGVAHHRSIVQAGLGNYASDYMGAASFTKQGERAFIGTISVTVDITAFPAPDAVSVQATSLSREERFYARPPSGGWE